MAQRQENINLKFAGDGLEQIVENTKSLKAQLREAQAEVANMSDKFGATSHQAIAAAKAAGELKDKIGDAKALTDAFNPDAKFKAFSSSLAGVAGGFSVATGAMGLFGSESEDVEKMLLKVQSAMALASGLQQLGEARDSFKQLGAVIKDVFIKTTVKTTATEVDTAATLADAAAAEAAALAEGERAVASVGVAGALGLETVATEAATVATEEMAVAMSLSPLGAFLLLLGAAAAAFVYFSNAGDDATASQKDYDEALKSTNKTMEKVYSSVEKTKVMFKEFHDGSISGKDALKQWNDTMGDSYGRFKNIADAEKSFIENTRNYIGAAQERAVADALLAKNAQLRIEAGNGDFTKIDVSAWELTKGLARGMNGDEIKAEKYKELTSEILDNTKQIEKSMTTADKLTTKTGAASKNEKYTADTKPKKKSGKSAEEIAKEDEVKARILNAKRVDQEIEDEINEFERQINTAKKYEDKYQKEILKAEADTETKKVAAQKKAEQKEVDDLKLTGDEKLRVQKAFDAKFKKLEDDAAKTDAKIVFDKNKKDLIDQIKNDDLAYKEKKKALDKLRKLIGDAKKDGIISDKDALEAKKEAADEEAQVEKNKNEAIKGFMQDGIDVADNLAQIGLMKGKDAQNVSKALTLAQIGVDTASAFSSLLKGSEATGAAAGPGYLPVKFATYATGIISILANVARAKQLLSGGDASSAGGGGGASAPSVAAAPRFNVVGNSGVNQLAQTMGANKMNQQPIKTYVVAGDVTTAQGLNRSIVNNASLG